VSELSKTFDSKFGVNIFSLFIWFKVRY